MPDLNCYCGSYVADYIINVRFGAPESVIPDAHIFKFPISARISTGNKYIVAINDNAVLSRTWIAIIGNQENVIRRIVWHIVVNRCFYAHENLRLDILRNISDINGFKIAGNM